MLFGLPLVIIIRYRLVIGRCKDTTGISRNPNFFMKKIAKHQFLPIILPVIIGFSPFSPFSPNIGLSTMERK